jgi:outer membrane protein assembly factor BamB
MMRRLLGLWFSFLVANFVATTADWPRFLGPLGKSVSPETNLVASLSSTGLPVVFDIPTGPGYAAPSVSADRLVLFHRKGAEEIIEALDSGNGRPIWRFAYPTTYEDPYGYNNGPRSTPLISSNRVYTFGAEGILTALDLADGHKIWQRNTATEWQIPQAFFGVGSTPILEGNRLLVMVGGQTNSGMAALDPASGKTIWESVGYRSWQGQPMYGWPEGMRVDWKPWEKQASYASPVAATVNGERLVYCLMRQGLVALSPRDGEVRFSRWFRARVDDSVNASDPIAVGNQVFISSAYYKSGSVLLQVAPGNTNFTEKWRGLSMEMHWSTPILINGNLYGFSGRNEPDAFLRCIDFETGEIRWERDERWPKHSSTQPPVFGRGSFIFADGKLIALGEGGLLGLFRPDPAKCDEIGRWQVPSLHHPCWAAPVLSNGRLYLRSEDRLVCLNIRRS